MTRRQAGLLGVALAAGVTGCGGDGALDPPVLVSPSQGDTTGSVWSDAALRPQFWWRAVDRASQYQVMVDDSCLMGTPCTFPSPEIDQMIAGTTFRPAAALPVSTTPPVGRRYFWHVRGCAGATCGPWSPTHYVDIGRQQQDFNGDGYADLVENDSNGATVFFGDPALTFDSRWSGLGDLLAGGYQDTLDTFWAGDTNGDGFADLAVTAAFSATGAEGLRLILGGSPPAALASLELGGDQGWTEIFGAGAAGDLDGDGFADISFSAYRASDENAFVLRGGPVPSNENLQVLVSDVARVKGCDLDGDGISDLLFQAGATAPYLISLDAAGTSSRVVSLGTGRTPTAILGCVGDVVGDGGRVMLGREADVLGLFRVSGQELVPVNDCPISGPTPSSAFTAIRLGDVDGDGKEDFVAGDPATHQSFLFYDVCRGGMQELPGRVTASFDRVPAGGNLCTAGDLNGDGVADLAVGNLETGIDSIVGGEIHVYVGGATVGLANPIVLPSVTSDGLSTYLGGLH